jgi:hypothetical protein
MKVSRLIAVIGIVATVGNVGSHADIAFQVASSGIYQTGGSWAGGPWTEAGFLYQAIWSDLAPDMSHVATPGGGTANGQGANEFVLFSRASVHSYGYVQYADTPSSDTQKRDSDVGGNNINAGYLYFRLFSTAAPVGGDKYYESAAVDTANDLVDIDLDGVFSPGDISPINATGGGPQATNRPIPEPTTLALLALSGLVFAFRKPRCD